MELAAEFIKRKDREFQYQKEQGRLIRMKDIGGEGRMVFTREAWSFMRQHNYKNKVFVVERLKKQEFEGRAACPSDWKKGDIEYRIGYYIIGQNGRVKGKWTWGQYCPMIPEQDFKKLILKAKRERVIKNF